MYKWTRTVENHVIQGLFVTETNGLPRLQYLHLVLYRYMFASPGLGGQLRSRGTDARYDPEENSHTQKTAILW